MKTNRTILLAAATLAAVTIAAPCFANPDGAAADDARAVERANGQFYASLDALFIGDAAPMTQVWSHAADVSYMGPMGGFLVGWEQVQAAWETQAAMKLGGKIEARETRATVGGDMACVQCVEEGENRDGQGRVLKVSIRATNLFRKENGEWKMFGHHTDRLPRLERQYAPAHSPKTPPLTK